MNNVEKLNDILKQFKIGATCRNFGEYKNSFYYDLELKPGTRIQNIEKYINELSLILKAPSKPQLDLLLQLLLGEDTKGLPLWFDMETAPHMIIGGATGSGKSTLLHSIIANLLVMDNVMIDLIDTKNIEFFKYNDRFDRIAVACDYDRCIEVLENLYEEMEERYKIMRDGGIVDDYFPYHVLIIDEFADLVMQDVGHTMQKLLCGLAQKCRAAGIHIILATQRPAASILSGEIKANFPARIALKTASGIDSKIILDSVGAEELNGFGDAIIKSNEHYYSRFQSASTNPDEVYRYFGDR